MSRYIYADTTIVLANTHEQIEDCRRALRNVEMDWAYLWYGQPGTRSARRSSSRLWADPRDIRDWGEVGDL